ncbi:MAG: glycosyltransferase family 39 protein [Candidatus Protistobacter heckmanni]|nr:glycosyltransferase family 39 protein [Candidatus Protistobacter heckmanni]
MQITNDEAFFTQWGIHSDWGYYDHPPMIGWWLALLVRISDTPLMLRLPTILLSSVIGLSIVDLLRRVFPQRAPAQAWLAGAVYLMLPVSWIDILVTTDTPLVSFLFCSGYAFARAALNEGAPDAAAKAGGTLGWPLLCGVFLSLAFLSKYFTVLMGVAYAAALLTERGGFVRRFGRLLLIGLAALPFIAENVVYNATHCWNNIMFNLMNRNEDVHFSLDTIATYLVMMAYLITPWVLWRLWRARAELHGAQAEGGLGGTARAAALARADAALPAALHGEAGWPALGAGLHALRAGDGGRRAGRAPAAHRAQMDGLALAAASSAARGAHACAALALVQVQVPRRPGLPVRRAAGRRRPAQ